MYLVTKNPNILVFILDYFPVYLFWALLLKKTNTVQIWQQPSIPLKGPVWCSDWSILYIKKKRMVAYKKMKFVSGTDELSGFSLFLGLNCSDLSFVYQHSGPAILSTRVSLTFQANAPKVASCIGYFNNRTLNSVPSGYSAHAKVDICNLEVLGEAWISWTRIIRGSVNHMLCWDQFKNQMAFFCLNFHWLTAPTKEFQPTCVI